MFSPFFVLIFVITGGILLLALNASADGGAWRNYEVYEPKVQFAKGPLDKAGEPQGHPSPGPPRGPPHHPRQLAGTFRTVYPAQAQVPEVGTL